MGAEYCGWQGKCAPTTRIQYSHNIQVQGEAQGADAIIETLLKDLKEGPSHSQVSKVEQAEIDSVEGETAFEVRR